MLFLCKKKLNIGEKKIADKVKDLINEFEITINSKVTDDAKQSIKGTPDFDESTQKNQPTIINKLQLNFHDLKKEFENFCSLQTNRILNVLGDTKLDAESSLLLSVVRDIRKLESDFSFEQQRNIYQATLMSLEVSDDPSLEVHKKQLTQKIRKLSEIEAYDPVQLEKELDFATLLDSKILFDQEVSQYVPEINLNNEEHWKKLFENSKLKRIYDDFCFLHKKALFFQQEFYMMTHLHKKILDRFGVLQAPEIVVEKELQDLIIKLAHLTGCLKAGEQEGSAYS